MKKSLLVSLFGLTVLTHLSAQKNLVNGYILKSQFDTVYGIIDDKNYYRNSLYCEFSENRVDSLIRYYPGEIYGYRFTNGKYYISKNISIDGKDSAFFLEFLVHGELDFYFRQDNQRLNQYYVSKKGSQILPLDYSLEIIHRDGKMYQKENRKYIDVLEYLTVGHPEIQNEIQNLNVPEHKNLINFAEEYQDLVCKDEKCIIYEKKMRYRVLIEIAGGYKIISFENDYYRSSGTPFLGINLYINNPRFSERSYFGIGYFYEGKSIIDSSGVTYHNFKIPLTYGYSSSRSGFSPVFHAGFSVRNYDDHIFTTVSGAPGLKYNFKRFFLKAYVDFEFVSMILIPLGYHSTNFGISFNYKFGQ